MNGNSKWNSNKRQRLSLKSKKGKETKKHSRKQKKHKLGNTRLNNKKKGKRFRKQKNQEELIM